MPLDCSLNPFLSQAPLRRGYFFIAKFHINFKIFGASASWSGLFFIAKIWVEVGEMFIEFSNNPVGNRTGDCAVRAISKALGITWEAAYITLALNGLQMGDIMNGNSVIAAVLRKNGFYRKAISNTCPDCYDIREFCKEFPTGTYVVGTGTHVVTVVDGNYYDAWDSGNEIPQYYWEKEA